MWVWFAARLQARWRQGPSVDSGLSPNSWQQAPTCKELVSHWELNYSLRACNRNCWFPSWSQSSFPLSDSEPTFCEVSSHLLSLPWAPLKQTPAPPYTRGWILVSLSQPWYYWAGGKIILLVWFSCCMNQLGVYTDNVKFSLMFKLIWVGLSFTAS